MKRVVTAAVASLAAMLMWPAAGWAMTGQQTAYRSAPQGMVVEPDVVAGPDGREWALVRGNDGRWDNGDALEAVSPGGTTHFYGLNGDTICALTSGAGALWGVLGTDSSGLHIARFTTAGQETDSSEPLPASPDAEWDACDLAVDPSGTSYVGLSNGDQVWLARFDADGRATNEQLSIGSGSAGDYGNVYGVAYGADGNVWVLCSYGNTATGNGFAGLVRVSPDGSLTRLPVNGGGRFPLVAGPDGLLFPSPGGLTEMAYDGTSRQIRIPAAGESGVLGIAPQGASRTWWASDTRYGYVTTSGSRRSFPLSSDNTGSPPSAITDRGVAIAAGPAGDGSMWLVADQLPDVVRIAADRSFGRITATVNARRQLIVHLSGATGWRDLGGRLRSAPVMVTYDRQMYFYATGPGDRLFERTLHSAWHRISGMSCVDPSLERAGSELTIGCSLRAQPDGDDEPRLSTASLLSSRRNQGFSTIDLRYDGLTSVGAALSSIDDPAGGPLIAARSLSAPRDRLELLHPDQSPPDKPDRLPVTCAGVPTAQASGSTDLVACVNRSHHLVVDTLGTNGQVIASRTYPGFASGRIGLLTNVDGRVVAYGLGRKGHVESLRISGSRTASWRETRRTGRLGVACIDL